MTPLGDSELGMDQLLYCVPRQQALLLSQCRQNRMAQHSSWEGNVIHNPHRLSTFMGAGRQAPDNR